MMTAYEIETRAKHNCKSDEASVVFSYVIFLLLCWIMEYVREGEQILKSDLLNQSNA